MPKKIIAPELNLKPEETQVLSNDFNLFYKPTPLEVDPTISKFTRELDAFNKNVVYKEAIIQTAKEKTKAEAEAVAAYNNSKLNYADAVEKGIIPKEASPFFIEKYQELEMENKAAQFKAKVYQSYAENGVVDNLLPNAFENFYKDELKKFIKENGLANVDPLLLENGFFKNTSATRKQLEQTHVTSQMSKIADNHRKAAKESFQIEFNSDKSAEEIGVSVGNKVKGIVASGLSKGSARKYLMESIKEYAENTADPEKFKTQLPQILKNLNLGTDSLFNVKGLKDEFDKIEEVLQDRIEKKEQREISKAKRVREKEYSEGLDFADKYDNLATAEQDPQFKTFSKFKQDKIRDIFKQRAVGYGSSNDQNLDKEIDEKLKAQDFEGAYDHLIKNQTRVTESKFNQLKDYVNQFKIGGKDGLLSDDDYEFYKKQIESYVQKAGAFKISNINPFEVDSFEKDAIKWIAANKSNFTNKKEYEDAFRQYVKARYEVIKQKIISSFASSSNISTNPNDEGTIKKPSKVKADLNKINKENK